LHFCVYLYYREQEKKGARKRRRESKRERERAMKELTSFKQFELIINNFANKAKARVDKGCADKGQQNKTTKCPTLSDTCYGQAGEITFWQSNKPNVGCFVCLLD